MARRRAKAGPRARHPHQARRQPRRRAAPALRQTGCRAILSTPTSPCLEITAQVARQRTARCPSKSYTRFPTGSTWRVFTPTPEARAQSSRRGAHSNRRVRRRHGGPAGAGKSFQALLIPRARPALVGDAAAGDRGRRRRAAAAGAGYRRARAVRAPGGRAPRHARLYAAFDLFALSSKTEGLPLVLPEAMAQRPAGGLRRRWAACPQVITPEVGELVPPGDAAAARRGCDFSLAALAPAPSPRPGRARPPCCTAKIFSRARMVQTTTSRSINCRP